MMTFPSTPKTRATPVAHKFVWPQRAPKVDPSRSESSSQLTVFFKFPKILLSRFRCRTSFTSLVTSPLWDFYFDICERHMLRARVNTCAQVSTKLTHVLSRKVLSLTKLKGKIYKTKYLSHYITLDWKLKNCKLSYKTDLVWLVLVLWHINCCRLFNAKSIFIHINSSISNNSV